MGDRKLKAVDFFCGAGGVSTGLTSIEIQVLGGIDVDKDCKSTYEVNHPGSTFLLEDISKLSVEDFQAKLNVYPNDDDLIFVGCSPCQYYTKIRTSKDKSEKSKLLLEDFQKFVEHFKPGYILIENVPGIEKKSGSPLEAFKVKLTKLGYSFKDKVLHAEKLGVPQTRRRYVLIATRLPGLIELPVEIENPELKVRKFIGDESPFIFEEIKAGEIDSTDRRHTAAGLSPLNIRRLQKTPKDGGTRLAWKDDPELQLQCYLGKDDLFRNIYSRMFWEQPAPTITTKFLRISNGRFAHPEQNRGISIREGATLQTFPPEYKFITNNIDTAARLIGNAVPPKLAAEIGQSLKNHWKAWLDSKQEQGH